jgi:purine-binding chemotaxis protein CheW
MSDTAVQDYDIGGILAQMRDEYWHALAQEEPEVQHTVDCLVCRLGGEEHAFETRFAAEVIRVPRLVKVPEVPEIIAGIFNLRGAITAATDIRPLLGLPSPPLGPSGRLLVVKGEGFQTGILAEAALGVQGLLLEEFHPCEGESRPFLKGEFRPADAPPVRWLDLEALLASPLIIAGEDEAAAK